MDTKVDSSVSVSRGTAIRSRRRWSVQEKVRIVLETLEAGVSVPAIARRHCVNANQLFIWRSQYRRGELGANDNRDRAINLLPVQVEPSIAPRSKVAILDAERVNDFETPVITRLESNRV